MTREQVNDPKYVPPPKPKMYWSCFKSRETESSGEIRSLTGTADTWADFVPEAKRMIKEVQELGFEPEIRYLDEPGSHDTQFVYTTHLWLGRGWRLTFYSNY